ncbi:hypothetical protein Srufu_002000 [Streptomyces libani subsp. rufus]|nr:hypothetical protein Srufu_002000 [Streptomyces libani subsp. rufus]
MAAAHELTGERGAGGAGAQDDVQRFRGSRHGGSFSPGRGAERRGNGERIEWFSRSALSLLLETITLAMTHGNRCVGYDWR